MSCRAWWKVPSSPKNGIEKISSGEPRDSARRGSFCRRWGRFKIHIFSPLKWLVRYNSWHPTVKPGLCHAAEAATWALPPFFAARSGQETRTARRRADPHRRPSPLGPPALAPGNLANPARQGLRSPHLSGDPGDGRGKGGLQELPGPGALPTWADWTGHGSRSQDRRRHLQSRRRRRYRLQSRRRRRCPRSLRRAASRTAASPRPGGVRCGPPPAAPAPSPSPGPPPPGPRSLGRRRTRSGSQTFCLRATQPPSRPGTPPPPPHALSLRGASLPGSGVTRHRAPAPRPHAHLAGRGRAGWRRWLRSEPSGPGRALISLPCQEGCVVGSPAVQVEGDERGPPVRAPLKCPPSPEVLGTRKTGNTVIHPGSIETKREVW